ncbi:hypothetical protein D3C87_2102860 [compost metagenome]
MFEPAARIQVADEVIRVGRFIDAVHLPFDACFAKLHAWLVTNTDYRSAALFK